MKCLVRWLLRLASTVLLLPGAMVPVARGSALPSAASNRAAESQQSESTITIPGPLRSFLRMAGLSQNLSSGEVLPLFARNMLLHGYEVGRPTEYLILVRRYIQQADELTALANNNVSLHLEGCRDAERLLHVLGYRIQGDCGSRRMSLVTADADRAFLTTDSGFPLVDLEESLQQNRPFVLDYAGSKVPVMFAADDWTAVASVNGQKHKDLLEAFLYQQDLARLYWALSRIDPETRVILKKSLGLTKLFPLAPALDLYGSQVCIRSGAVIVPGGPAAEKQWQDLVGASPRQPSEFAFQLFKKDRGWLAAYFDAMARTSQEQQQHFAADQRFKRYYAAFRSPGVSGDATARMAFRPAPELLVLVARLEWQSNGEPYVPGSAEIWSDIVGLDRNAKLYHYSGKRFRNWHTADQVVEAMFAFSREETEDAPVQVFLGLSELDYRRGPQRQLSDATVFLLAQKFPEFRDQYRLFTEFPELSDGSITNFVNTAEALNKISDISLRGNAMGIFQANVGIWQIFARQGQIERARLNPSFQAAIQPFGKIGNAVQLFTAARDSVQEVMAATGDTTFSQEGLIDLIAGAYQSDADGKQMHTEMANRIRAVMADQRLVSLDTLFALDDGLKQANHQGADKDRLLALAAELREFEMPRPIFTAGERTRWAPGVYNNRHTELQMRTDLAKVLSSSASGAQREKARGQLATFLRDSLVGLNYAYYEPPGSQVLHNNALFVRSHDFSGETVLGVEHLWRGAELFGAGSPAGGGAHLVGSLADLPYVLAQAEQDFIAPDHVQALIWQQLVPEVLSNATVPRWWNVSRNEMHAVALYQRAGEELLVAAAKDQQLREKAIGILSDRMAPEQRAWVEQALQAGTASDAVQGVMPADTFYLTMEFRKRDPGQLEALSPAGAELQELSRKAPDDVNLQKLARDFGTIHPVFAHTYGREFVNVKPFPALGGMNSRLMGECWDSGNLYWARLADELGYPPVMLNRVVPELTRQMVQKIFASDLDDWPAVLRALHETGEQFREGKVAFRATGPASAN